MKYTYTYVTYKIQVIYIENEEKNWYISVISVFSFSVFQNFLLTKFIHQILENLL